MLRRYSIICLYLDELEVIELYMFVNKIIGYFEI